MSRWHRQAAVGAMAASLGIFAVVLPLSSEASATGSLHEYTVNVNGDGSVTSVETSTVSSGGTSDQMQVSPMKAAGELPVAVQVAYVYDGHSGTDLSRVQGKSGTVEIDVTVRNTTQHSTTIESGGRLVNGIVATPVTVVASAAVSSGSYTALTAPPAGSTPQSADSAGVVGSSSDGSPLVQWASLLAPPVLSSESTFRLIENTTSFSAPKFTVVAKPGVVTDASLAKLLVPGTTAQSSDDSSWGQLVSSETRTITLVTNVVQQINDAGSMVRELRSTLKQGAVAKTEATAQQLRQANTQLGSEIESLISTLGSDSSSLRSTIKSNLGTAVQDIRSAQLKIDSFVGTSAVDTTVTPSAGTCQLPVEAVGVAQPSLIDEINLFADEAEKQVSAAGICASSIEQQTASTYASIESDLTSDGGVMSGVLGAVKSATTATITGIRAQVMGDPSDPTSTNGRFDSLASSLSSLRSDVEAVNAAVEAVDAAPPSQSALSDIGASQNDVSNLQSDLDAATSKLSDIEDAVTALGTSATSVSQAVAAEYSSDGTSGGSQKLLAGLQALESVICSTDVAAVLTGPTLSTDQATSDDLSVTLTGYSCTDWNAVPPPSGPSDGSLEALASANENDWSTVAGAGLSTAVSGLSAQVSTLDGDLNTLASDVTAVNGHVGKSSTDLQAEVTDLQAEVSTVVGDVDAICANTCTTGAAGSLPDLFSHLNTALDLVASSSQTSIDSSVGDPTNPKSGGGAIAAILDHVKGVSPGGGSVEPQGATDVLLNDLVDAAVLDPSSTSANQQTENLRTSAVGTVVPDLRGKLDHGSHELRMTLRGVSKQTRDQLRQELNSAATDLRGTKAELRSQVSSLLELIGSKGGGGILGYLTLSIADAGSTGTQLGRTTGQSRGFNAVLSRSVQGVDLQVAELNAGLQQAADRQSSGQELYVFSVKED